MRSTRSKELFAAKKEAENQRKALSDKILTLERQVKDARYREEEERRNFDEKLKSGPQTRGEIEAEYAELQRTKIEIENEY